MTEPVRHWDDWRWQLRNRITTKEELEKLIELIPEEIKGIESLQGKGMGLNITPYYASLVDPKSPNDPIRRTVVPRIEETIIKPCEMEDPLAEDRMSPVPGLVRRYPDRVLLLVTDHCASYCRYCTRRRLVGHKERPITKTDFKEVVRWLKEHREIKDVLISGGDPLTLETTKLEDFLRDLYAIPHIDLIRIGTKAPVTMPMRITSSLCNTLRSYHPLFISINFIHPKEITDECKEACIKLAEAGIPLGSQTVLLKGVNDDVPTMRKLMHELLKIRVKPYYIYQCDLAQGTDHFRTPVSTGIKIINKLRGFTTGFGVPTYVIDGPGGLGKIPVSPDYVVSRDEKKIILRNFKDKTCEYPEVENESN